MSTTAWNNNSELWLLFSVLSREKQWGIPAPAAYVKAVVVKKLVVGCMLKKLGPPVG